MRFVRSAGITLGLKVMSLAFALGVSIILGRVLGAEGRGVYGLVMTVIVLASSFGIFGIGSANTFFVARDKSCARQVGIQSLLVGLVGGVMTTAIVLGLSSGMPSMLQGINGVVLVMTIVLIPIYLWGNLFSRSFLGLGDVVAFNAFETMGRIVFFGAGLVTILWLNMTLDSFLTAVAVCMAVFIVVYIYRYFRLAEPGGHNPGGLISRSLAYGLRAYIAAVFTWATIRSGIFFVNHFNGPSDAGLFSVAQQLSELLIIIPSVVGTVLFPGWPAATVKILRRRS